MTDELRNLLDIIQYQRYEIISFDLFDTLIRRKVAAPEHVFWNVAREYAHRIGEPTLTSRIYDARVLAGMLAPQRARLRGKEEASLAEIYEVFASVLPQMRSRTDEIMALEIEEERRALEPYPFGARLFEAARAAGKRILISSDQYLPIGFLDERLQTFGYRGYEKILLSGDIGILKTTGSLYEWITMHFGVDRNAILHIGDNPFVDVHVANKKGLKGTLLPRSDALAKHPGRDSSIGRRPSLGSWALAHYLNQLADDVVVGRETPTHDDIDFLGYTFLGPLLCYLAAWVTVPLRNGEIERLWLLARDGEGLSKVVKLLYPELAGQIDYIYASRRMLVYPTGCLTGLEIFRHYEHLANSDVTVLDFLGRISSEETDFTTVGQYFKPDDRVNDRSLRGELERRLDARCAALRAEVGSDANERRRRYYRSFARGAKRIGLFDIGWRGNLQRAMEQLFDGSDLKFTGFYVGQLYENETYKAFVDADCFAFSYNFPGNAFEDIVYNIWPLELILSGTELSAHSVWQSDEVWHPVYEQDTPSKAASRALAVRLQNAAVRFVREVVLTDEQIKQQANYSPEGLELLREFLARPASFDAKALSELTWAMNIDDEGKTLIAHPEKQTGRALSRARAASYWPAGFDALQSPRSLRRMRRYWKQRYNRRKFWQNIRRRLRRRD